MKKIAEADRKEMPLYPIGIVAELIGITEQTLRLYEKHGLIRPARRNKNRYYSDNDIKWLTCIRDIIHNKKISIEGIKKLLGYAPCWEITDCPPERKEKCTAQIDKSRPCWELNKMRCSQERQCEDCVVYIAGQMRKK
ncbi:MAG: MerR family transcriptional regulator [Nitrospirota bacterium]